MIALNLCSLFLFVVCTFLISDGCVFDGKNESENEKLLKELFASINEEVDSNHRKLFREKAVSSRPTVAPTKAVSSRPTVAAIPTRNLISARSPRPTAFPTTIKTKLPTPYPTIPKASTTSNLPTIQASAVPTSEMSSCNPTIAQPTINPSELPTKLPSTEPTQYPTTQMPTKEPFSPPSSNPTILPSVNPSRFPTVPPTYTSRPTPKPTTSRPTISLNPTIKPPTPIPTKTPTANPSFRPTSIPSAFPTTSPTSIPSASPTSIPSAFSTASPTRSPTTLPSITPSSTPTAIPSSAPTTVPSVTPSSSPTRSPTRAPSTPTVRPTPEPSSRPTSKPSNPSNPPTTEPTAFPTTASPSAKPSTRSPTMKPTKSVQPTPVPTSAPTNIPSPSPTNTGVPTTITLTYPICSITNSYDLIPTKASICSAYSGMVTQFNILSNSIVDIKIRAHLFGASVRIVWHDAGEYDMNQQDLSGPDGCLSNRVHNAGLWENDSPIIQYVEPIYQMFCDKISRADFWVLWGKIVLEYADQTKYLQINKLISFQYGRSDRSGDCMDGYGRLPSAQGNLTTIKQVFINRLGLTLKDAVTLMGAHCLGNVHADYSGYGLYDDGQPNTNAWASSPSYFTNEYYQSLTFSGNQWKNLPGDDYSSQTSIGKNLWTGYTGTGTRKTIMLNTDMSMYYPITTLNKDGSTTGDSGQTCSSALTSNSNQYGCISGDGSTILTSTSKPSLSSSYVDSYASSLTGYLSAFATSYAKMTCVGFGVPASADGSTSSGRLGTLTSIDLSTCPTS
eukprot:gene6765-9266_t